MSSDSRAATASPVLMPLPSVINPCLARARCPARRDHRRQRLVPAHGRGPPPREQDVLGSVDVPVVSVTTPAAHPCSYSKHVQTCGSRSGPTAAACSRCVALVDDLYAPAGLLAFVLQLRLEHPPASIECGLGHPRLRQPG